jgi:hypothetical protein
MLVTFTTDAYAAKADIVIDVGGEYDSDGDIYIPITSMIIISVLITVILNFFKH